MPDGFIGNININNVFFVIFSFYFSIFLPIVCYKITHNETIKLIMSTFSTVVIGLLLIEFCCFVIINTKIVNSNSPNYPALVRHTKNKTFFADISKEWGLWHYSDSVRHQYTCYDALYKKNKYGARDKEREKISNSKRILLLGDSFIEGYVMTDSLRISNRLEDSTKVEHLNFGCGSFGVTQEYLVYHHLARFFTHDAVMIGLLPSNDFIDDNIDKNDDGRYRPYWVGNYPNYKIKYKTAILSDSDAYPDNIGLPTKRTLSLAEKIKNWLVDNTYTYYILTYKNVPINAKNATKSNWVSGFENFSKEEWDRLVFSLKKIKADTQDKTVFILGLPTIQDLIVRDKRKTKMPFTTKMEAFCKENNWVYIDILEYIHASGQTYDTLYLSCDGHFSALGHKLASEAILSNKSYRKTIKQYR